MIKHFSLQYLLKNTLLNKREAEILLAEILQQPRSYLLAHPESTLTDDQYQQWQRWSKRRVQGEPIAYIIGKREFFSLMLQVSSDVLIPRHETELLVEIALDKLPTSGTSILELGTGSGAIALALAYLRPDWQIVATDISTAALTVARKNSQQLGLKNITFVQSDWFTAIPAQKFSAIISNPPYIAASDSHLQQGDLPFEPMQALVAAAEGLQCLRHIIQNAHAWLQPKGWIFLEHGYNQKEAVQQMLQQQSFQHIQSWRDLAGIWRVTGGIC